MSTDIAVPSQLFYKLEEVPDQLPELYPLSPQKTQLQELKREKKCVLQINTQAVTKTITLLTRSFTLFYEDKCLYNPHFLHGFYFSDLNK